MIVEIPDDDSIIKWKMNDKDDWKSAEILDLINAYEGSPKGEWRNHRNDYGHNIADCSLCGKTMQWHDEDGDGVPRYCWYCGAPMKGVKNEFTKDI